jgi:hypothetical protein
VSKDVPTHVSTDSAQPASACAAVGTKPRSSATTICGPSNRMLYCVVESEPLEEESLESAEGHSVKASPCSTQLP